METLLGCTSRRTEMVGGRQAVGVPGFRNHRVRGHFKGARSDTLQVKRSWEWQSVKQESHP